MSYPAESLHRDRFLEETAAIPFGQLADAGAAVENEEELAKMREHILTRHEGVEVVHTFQDVVGQVWDCIPVEHQLSVRKQGGEIAKEPELPGAEEKGGSRAPEGATLLQSPLEAGGVDRFGNERSCPDGTIPRRRLTLLEMSRFAKVADFFSKGPGGLGQHPRLTTEAALSASHKYAHAYQSLDNLGGSSVLNVWQPTVNTGASQIFSLSQQWFAGGSGSSLQTVECGWQVYPQKYGNTYANLFIYWTADGYGSTGCYNLDCSAFVQTNPGWTLGGYLLPASVTGGSQYEMPFGYYLAPDGNWWFYLKQLNGTTAVGYYPGSLFNQGVLASKATEIDFGGETVGTTSWPPMGSGAFASNGWAKAAYQRDARYFDMQRQYSHQASLKASQHSPSCYTIDVNSGSSPWNEYFYFGGPGGTGC